MQTVDQRAIGCRPSSWMAARTLALQSQYCGCCGTETTETKRKRRHLAGSGQVPRLRSAVAVEETAVALLALVGAGAGAGAKRQAAAARLAVAALLHSSLAPASPPAGCFSPLRRTLLPAGGSGSLLVVHQGWTRLHPRSWGRWTRSLAYLFISVLQLGISKHEPPPISSARDKTGHDKPI